MRRITTLLLLLSAVLAASAQNPSEIRTQIRESLERFAAQVSAINDAYEPISIATTSKDFGVGRSTYFYYNGRSELGGEPLTLERFLDYYNSAVLKRRFIEHEFDFNVNSIEKVDSKTADDRRYKVSARLLRTPANMADDYLIRPADVDMIVQWNGDGKDVTLLEVKMPAELGEVYPVMVREYDFSFPGGSSLSFDAEGSPWRSVVRSRMRDVKKYPGVPGHDVAGEYVDVPFELTADKQTVRQLSLGTDGMYITGTVRPNYDRNGRSWRVGLRQVGTSNTAALSLFQEKRRGVNNPFKFDADDLPYLYVALHSGLKYHVGWSFMGRKSGSRFAFGVQMGFSADVFRAWNGSSSSSWISSSPNEGIVNGYKVTETWLDPKEAGYSELFDPEGKAKSRYVRYELMGVAAFNIFKWLRFDLGVGAVSREKQYKLEGGYDVIEYSYTPVESGLPALSPVYRRIPSSSTTYFQDGSKWGFGLRPGLTFEIPLDSYDTHFLTLGVSYTKGFGLKHADSFEFSIGIGFGD